MSNLWWLQPGWTDSCCSQCGVQIYPEGDPDWGMCYQCYSHYLHQMELEAQYLADLEREQNDQGK